MSSVLKVIKVEEDSQAKHLGILVGDIIVSYNETPVNSSLALSNAVQSAKKSGDEQVEIVIVRDGQQILLQALPAERLGFLCESKDNSKPPAKKHRPTYTSDYGIARTVAGIISTFGWILVVVGVFVTVVPLLGGNARFSVAWFAMMPGLGTVASGFLMIMGAQVTQATVDNADHTREILAEMRANN